MRAQLREIAARLYPGRSRWTILGEIAAFVAVIVILWLAACAFVVLEPLP